MLWCSGVVTSTLSCPVYLADCTTSGRVLSIPTRKLRSSSTSAPRVPPPSLRSPDLLTHGLVDSRTLLTMLAYESLCIGWVFVRPAAAGLLLWPRRAGGRLIAARPALSSKREQCHVDSWRRKLNADLFRVSQLLEILALLEIFLHAFGPCRSF